MRLKIATKYIFSEMKYPILIFYGIILVMSILFSVSLTYEHSSFNGMEMISAIFLFILGLNSFRKNYLFLLTNGISRKTQFKGFILAIILITAGMTAIDMVIGLIWGQLAEYNSAFDQTYHMTLHSPGNVFTAFLWSMSLLLFTLSSGYFITTAFYRMPKIVKIFIAIGIPVFFTLILPAIAFRFFSKSFILMFFNVIGTLFGVHGGYRPMNAVATFLALTVIFLVFSYLLIRRAPVKEG
ncbi:MAG TPA: hypothetical protein VHP38_00880 [Ruminiclostridium sp.]|nr:hypothetical protein [Ruminiclostridium sp.]